MNDRDGARTAHVCRGSFGLAARLLFIISSHVIAIYANEPNTDFPRIRGSEVQGARYLIAVVQQQNSTRQNRKLRQRRRWRPNSSERPPVAVKANYVLNNTRRKTSFLTRAHAYYSSPADLSDTAAHHVHRGHKRSQLRQVLCSRRSRFCRVLWFVSFSLLFKSYDHTGSSGAEDLASGTRYFMI